MSTLLFLSKANIHKLVIVRHGQSIWNKEKRWAGWTDVPLSRMGIKQAKECAKLIKHANLQFDQVYTSVLTRAIRTTNYILDEIDAHYLPVQKHWRLNEKHYGSLQGQNKIEINEKYGGDLVTSWRRSFDIPPPQLDVHDSRHPIFDPRYKNINPQFLPSSESLSDIIDRLKPLWNSHIKIQIENQKRILIVAHGSSLRALLYLLGQRDTEMIKQFNIPNATPIVMSLGKDLKPLKYEYLGDENEIAVMMEKIKNETKRSNVE